MYARLLETPIYIQVVPSNVQNPPKLLFPSETLLSTLLLSGSSMELPQEERSSPTLEDCLKLLSGERDEQRLAGLLLVTKFCRSDDLVALRRIFDAVGSHFLDRLLWTGAGKGAVTGNGGDNRDAYLQLSVTVLAGFCRVPDIAASQDMVSKIPVVLEILSKQEYSSSSSVLEECYEFLYLVSSASEDGIMTWYETGGLKMLATHMPVFPDGSHQIGLAMKFIQLLLSKVSLDAICSGYLLELSLTVVIVARQFAVSHDAVKFEAMHLLSAILSSSHSAPLYEALRILPDSDWQGYMRDGIVAILQNRVVPEEKLYALTLAESVISILGERWLVGQVTLPKMEESIPADRCLMLVLEQSRVEVSVLLNELAYLKYEASKSSSSIDDAVRLKQRTLATPFSLIEKIIKLISGENEGDFIDESTTLRVIKGLNETIGIVLEYLQDAKEHGQRKGDDLLASVRVVGSYLAETPIACKEKVRELLEYMLSIESEEEDSPFYSVCFLLPLMCQLTMDIEGCKAVVSSGGHKSVINCLVNLIGPNRCRVDNKGCVFLACDTVLNLLLKKEQVKFTLDESTVVDLLKAVIHWTEGVDEPSVVMMGSCICSLICDLTTEAVLLRHSNFDQRALKSLSMLIAKSLGSCGQDMSSDPEGNVDLLEIIEAGYARWAARFPHVRDAVER